MKEKENMENLAFKIENYYSYEDLLKIDDEKRYEIIDGELFLMSSPRASHQLILGELHLQIASYLKNKKCKVLISPLDIILTKEKDVKKAENVVQPDILIVCDTDKINKNYIKGAPDCIIEILSPSNRVHDTLRKFNLYQKYGVKEYWIIDTEEKLILAYVLDKNGIYTLPKAYEITEEVKLNVLEDFNISLKDFYEENFKLLNNEN